MTHKKIILSISFLLLFAFGFSFGFFSPNIDIDREIITKLKASDGEISIITPENKTYTEPDSGYYPSTYGFENDNEGSVPYGWTQEGGGNGYVNVLEYPPYDTDHRNVVRVQERDTYQRSRNTFSTSQTHGTVEFWVQYGDFSTHNPKVGDIKIYQSSDTEGIFLRMEDGNIKYYASGGWNYIQTITADIWYHFRFDFESASNIYEGLGADKWHLYINEVKVSDAGFNYKAANNFMSQIEFYVSSPGYYHLLLDGVGYSWDPDYRIGDNLNEGLLLSYDNIINLDWQGYSLDGQANRTILGNSTIPMPSDGVHNIQVFGNDSMDAIYESELRYFTVNTAPPAITINSPTDSQVIGETAPSYDLSITGPYNSIWYTFDAGATNHTATGLTGTLNTAAWSGLSDGIITIDFYANNSAGMFGTAQVQVFKDSSVIEPPTIPGYNFFFITGIIGIISTVLLRKRLKS